MDLSPSAVAVRPATDGPDGLLTFADWIAGLGADGYSVLAAHRVPAQLWLARGDEVLHFLARGTRFTLRRYAAADLTRLILRSECDCEEHRTAGAGFRVALAPHAVPLAEVVLDGAARFGWSAVEAALAPPAAAAAALDELLEALPSTGPAADQPTGSSAGVSREPGAEVRRSSVA